MNWASPHGPPGTIGANRRCSDPACGAPWSASLRRAVWRCTMPPGPIELPAPSLPGPALFPLPSPGKDAVDDDEIMHILPGAQWVRWTHPLARGPGDKWRSGLCAGGARSEPAPKGTAMRLPDADLPRGDAGAACHDSHMEPPMAPMVSNRQAHLPSGGCAANGRA